MKHSDCSNCAHAGEPYHFMTRLGWMCAGCGCREYRPKDALYHEPTCDHPAIAPKGKLSDHRCTACGARVDWVEWLAR